MKALYEWREETAARTNRPARSLCRDDLIIEIARRNPTREQDLRVIRGLPRRDVAAILQTVTAARSIPLEQCPIVDEREQDPPQIQWVTNVLTAVLGDHCARSGLATNLVASNSDVKALVRSRLPNAKLPEDCPLTTGWRSVHVLPNLLAVLDGRKSVRINDLASDSPFVLNDEQPAHE